jgi:hypothetical protein
VELETRGGAFQVGDSFSLDPRLDSPLRKDGGSSKLTGRRMSNGVRKMSSSSKHRYLGGLSAFLIATAGCSPHVVLSAPPRNAPLADRQAAYRLLRPVSAAEISYSSSTSVDTELTLANGTTVYHAEDILPIVPADSASAAYVRRSLSKDSTGSVCVLVSTLSAVAFGLLLFGSSSYSEHSDLPKIGLAASGLSAAGFGVAGYFFRQAAAGDAMRAYEHYDEGLQKQLSLCVGASCGPGSIHDTRVQPGAAE